MSTPERDYHSEAWTEYERRVARVAELRAEVEAARERAERDVDVRPETEALRG